MALAGISNRARMWWDWPGHAAPCATTAAVSAADVDSHWLPGLSDTAVIVNEFGAVGLDHLLLEAADQEVVALPNGCVCCAVRQDLADTLYRLLRRRANGELPPFQRLVLETSGLAEPSPILYTL